MEELASQPEGRQCLWIAGGLAIQPREGESFPAEATLSRFETHHRSCFTLILRNVNDRLAAERRIESLASEAEYLKTEIQELRHFEHIVGQSGPLQAVLRDIRQVAPTDASVLILGETGTGKELIARAIHTTSRRSDRPFVRVNCAAVPAHLMESEFFGHEKGAFTGATQKRDGRFALADGGTIFLDEIGELSIDLQAKLLRVLQEGEFEPVGSSHTRKIDARVVAATNCRLEESVKEGRFRSDLFYRLNVFPIVVPPLRDRADDIPLLTADFAARFAAEIGRAIEPPSAECLERLAAYDWPGNVRELQNVIERAVITSQDGRLNLARALPETSLARMPCVTANDPQPGRRVRTVAELQEEERTNILLALESANWRVAGEGGAASLLGMNASTLNSRIRTWESSDRDKRRSELRLQPSQPIFVGPPSFRFLDPRLPLHELEKLMHGQKRERSALRRIAILPIGLQNPNVDRLLVVNPHLRHAHVRIDRQLVERTAADVHFDGQVGRRGDAQVQFVHVSQHVGVSNIVTFVRLDAALLHLDLQRGGARADQRSIHPPCRGLNHHRHPFLDSLVPQGKSHDFQVSMIVGETCAGAIRAGQVQKGGPGNV